MSFAAINPQILSPTSELFGTGFLIYKVGKSREFNFSILLLFLFLLSINISFIIYTISVISHKLIY